MLIKVTERHIRNGNRHSPATCPVAIAMNERNSAEVCYYIFGEECHIKSYHGCQIVMLPKTVARRISRYDKTGRMEPFEFELPV